MGFAELFLLAIGLSMDAFAVAICKGLSTRTLQKKHYLIVGAWFGGFQALMPTVGYFLGAAFKDYIEAVDHWVAFALLLLIGGNMLKEGFSKEEEPANASFDVKTMLVLAVATAIDALAVGVAFALTPGGVNIASAAGIIGVTTFVLSAVGLKVGNVFGAKYKSRAEIAGGVILILIGCKILLESYNLLPF